MKLFQKIFAGLVPAFHVMFFSIHVSAAGSEGVEHNSQQFLEALEASGGQPIETLSPADARQVLVNAQLGAKLKPADVKVTRIKLKDDLIDLHVVRPVGKKGLLPAFMFFHGGGWILGDFPTHERFVRDLVMESGAAAVFVNYTPSPEVGYPVAVNQAYDATVWVAKNGHKLGVDGQRLAVAGNSVGGNMAAVVALMAKAKGEPDLRAQVLFWPVTNAEFNNASYEEFANGHFLSRSMMHWFWDAYTTDPNERKQIYASPLQASLEQLRGLPPTLIQTAEKDVLRDEGEDYARKLDAAGVSVVATRYNGMIHDFGLLNALSELPATKMAIHQAGEELKRRLR